jgi:hypothetical protein
MSTKYDNQKVSKNVCLVEASYDCFLKILDHESDVPPAKKCKTGLSACQNATTELARAASSVGMSGESTGVESDKLSSSMESSEKKQKTDLLFEQSNSSQSCQVNEEKSTTVRADGLEESLICSICQDILYHCIRYS